MPNRPLIVLFILCIWFVISFVSNILGPMMPIIIEDFHLSLGMAGFLPFSFFLAYGVVSVPAGILVEKLGPKTMLSIAFLFNLAGATALAALPVYGVVIGALFIIGMGMAALQVIINPLMRTAGGEEHFAFYSVMGQLVFGLASFVSPQVFSALMQQSAGGDRTGLLGFLIGRAPEGLPWVGFYIGFALIFMIVLAATRLMTIPPIELKADERAETLAVYRDLLANPKVLLFALGIIAYVGTESSLANWMSKFLETYHGVSPTEGGANAVALFWGLMSLGCLVGLGLLKLADSKLVLRLFACLAILSVAAALFGSADVSLYAFPLSGFFLSVMFSIIFSLALNSFQHHHGAFSGILCSGILGGAVLPLIIGTLGDFVGLRASMTLIFVLLIYILAISFWANPLVQNRTVSMRTQKPKSSGEHP